MSRCGSVATSGSVRQDAEGGRLIRINHVGTQVDAGMGTQEDRGSQPSSLRTVTRDLPQRHEGEACRHDDGQKPAQHEFGRLTG